MRQPRTALFFWGAPSTFTKYSPRSSISFTNSPFASTKAKSRPDKNKSCPIKPRAIFPAPKMIHSAILCHRPLFLIT
jgi:hypothetical protein